MPIHEQDEDKRERLTFGSIVVNVIYSLLLFVTALIAAIGLATYQWVETTKVFWRVHPYVESTILVCIDSYK